MTGKSKWSEFEQISSVEAIINGQQIEIAQSNLRPTPSIKTIERWVVKYKPTILKEIADKQDRQDKTRTDKIRQDKKRVRQDTNSHFNVHIVFLSDYIEALHTWLSSYSSKTNDATVRRREAPNQEVIRLEKIKKEVDKK